MYHPLHHKRTSIKGSRLVYADTIGWIGAILLISAYMLLSFELIDSKHLVYQLLNLFGAGGLLVFGMARKAYPSVATNSIWFVVALIAIINVFI